MEKEGIHPIGCNVYPYYDQKGRNPAGQKNFTPSLSSNFQCTATSFYLIKNCTLKLILGEGAKHGDSGLFFLGNYIFSNKLHLQIIIFYKIHPFRNWILFCVGNQMSFRWQSPNKTV